MPKRNCHLLLRSQAILSKSKRTGLHDSKGSYVQGVSPSSTVMRSGFEQNYKEIVERISASLFSYINLYNTDFDQTLKKKKEHRQSIRM